MRSKTRNIILISIAVILVIVIILCSTIFTVKNVKVNFLDTNHTLSEVSVENQLLHNNTMDLNLKH